VRLATVFGPTCDTADLSGPDRGGGLDGGVSLPLLDEPSELKVRQEIVVVGDVDRAG
jgi:hypothetical protein